MALLTSGLSRLVFIQVIAGSNPAKVTIMAHYTSKDDAQTVNLMPSGWVGAIPTWVTNMLLLEYRESSHQLDIKLNKFGGNKYPATPFY